MADHSHHEIKNVSKSNQDSQLNFQSNNIIEIDLAEKAQTIWDGRKIIAFFVIVCFAIVFFHTRFGPTEYTSTASLIQESDGASVGDFGSSFLQSLTGINMPSGGRTNMSAVATGRAPLPVSLYPQIVSSTEFQKELIYTELEFSTLDSTLTLYDYFQDHREPSLREKVYSVIGDFTIFLPITVFKFVREIARSIVYGIVNLFREDPAQDASIEVVDEDILEDDRIQLVTDEESSVITWLRTKIILTSENGVMTITTNLPDPKAAALVNVKLIEYIKDYITNYRMQKAQQNLEDTVQRYEIAKEEYDKAQLELAQYQDQNLNISTETASLEEQKLRNEESLRASIYNSLAQEVEQARMIVQQQMPVFNPLEKPNMPLSPSTGSSPLMLIFSVLLGLFLGIGFILIKSAYKSTKTIL